MELQSPTALAHLTEALFPATSREHATIFCHHFEKILPLASDMKETWLNLNSSQEIRVAIFSKDLLQDQYQNPEEMVPIIFIGRLYHGIHYMPYLTQVILTSLQRSGRS